MYFSGEGVLVAINYNGVQKAETQTPVYYNEKSVRQSEFYAAAMAGVGVEKMIEVHTEDWGGQTIFIDSSGRRFKIYRSYITEKDTVELTLQAGVI